MKIMANSYIQNLYKKVNIRVPINNRLNPYPIVEHGVDIDYLRFPVSADTPSGEIIVVDLRASVPKDVEIDVDKPFDCLLTRGGGRIPLSVAMLDKEAIKEGSDKLDALIQPYIIGASAVYVSSLSNRLNLDPYSTYVLYITYIGMLVSRYYPDYDIGHKTTLIKKLYQISRVSDDDIEKIVDFEVDDIEGLINSLKNNKDIMPRLSDITIDVIYTIIGALTNVTEKVYVLAGFESLTAFLGLLSVYSENTMYNKTGLFFTYKKFKRVLDNPVDMTKLLIKESTFK